MSLVVPRLTLVDRYVVLHFCKSAAVVLALLLALFGFMSLTEELDDVGVGSFTTIDAIAVVILTTPTRIIDMLPVTTLLGSVLGLGTLANHGELLALRASAKFLWPIMETGVSRRLSRIKAPTLVATSSRDAVVPAAHGAAWQQRIAGARLTTLKGAGHLAELEQPDAFATLVREFISADRVAEVA